MTILEALKIHNLRISNGETWLVVDDNGRFIVYRRRHGAKQTTTVIETDDETVAVAAMIGENE